MWWQILTRLTVIILQYTQIWDRYAIYPKVLKCYMSTMYACAQLLSHAQPFATPRTAACQAPLPMKLPNPEHWAGCSPRFRGTSCIGRRARRCCATWEAPRRQLGLDTKNKGEGEAAGRWNFQGSVMFNSLRTHRLAHQAPLSIEFSGQEY